MLNDRRQDIKIGKATRHSAIQMRHDSWDDKKKLNSGALHDPVQAGGTDQGDDRQRQQLVLYWKNPAIKKNKLRVSLSATADEAA